MQAIMNIFGKGEEEQEQGAMTENVDNLQEGTAAVGLPEASQGTKSTTYQDVDIKHGQAKFDVHAPKDVTVEGKDVKWEKREVDVARTEMQKETVQVTETVIEKQTVEQPVTVVEQVPTMQKDVVMKTEDVQREEVEMEKKKVQRPTTVQKPVRTEKPVLHEKELMAKQSHEVMKKITVVRPHLTHETRTVQKPVTRKRMVKVSKPVVESRKVEIEVPTARTEMVNITQPEIRDGKVDVQVPHEEERSVTFQEPVTVIRPAEQKQLAEAEPSKDKDAAPAQFDSKKKRDWAQIPVGLPFTEMVTRSQNFKVTTLATEQKEVRETWMVPRQYERKYIVTETKTVTVREVVMREVEEEIEETVLVPEEVEFEVTLMEEVEEEWPINKDYKEAVITSEVTLEPGTTAVPEIGSKEVEIEVPHTVTKTETIQRPEVVEKEVLIDRPVTKMQQVEKDVAVEKTRDVVIEKPVTVHDKRTIEVPVATSKDVAVQEMQTGSKTVVALALSCATTTTPRSSAVACIRRATSVNATVCIIFRPKTRPFEQAVRFKHGVRTALSPFAAVSKSAVNTVHKVLRSWPS